MQPEGEKELIIRNERIRKYAKAVKEVKLVMGEFILALKIKKKYSNFVLLLNANSGFKRGLLWT